MSDQVRDNIERARTFAGIAPRQYLVPYRSIAELLDLRAAQAPEAPFLIYRDEDSGERATYTYREFQRRVNQVANFLRRELGIARGERLASMGFNHPDIVLLYFACWKLGVTVAPQSAGEDDARIAFILQNARCVAALVQPQYAERFSSIRARVPGLRRVICMDASYRAALDQESGACDDGGTERREDECLLVYTSGTTGAPKGVCLSQYNLLADAHGMVGWQNITAATRLMCVLPIHHVNGIVVTLVTPLYAGASVLLLRRFKAGSFWRSIAEHRVNIVSMVPTLLQFLCEANESLTKYDLSALRYLICGAGTLSVALATRFEEQFGVRILHGYGLSEVTAYAAKMPPDLPAAEHKKWMREFGYPSIGVAFGSNEITIHDENGAELGPGERGEIVIRGHNVMLGYYERPDANAETFKHGWFRSGDEGFYERDEQGRKFFFITGRLKELINRGGVKYSPFEIEEVLAEIPGVKVGLAVAFDNDWYGEEVGAYVVPEAGAQLSEAQVLAYCRTRMPHAKAPKAVRFGDEVPVTSTGKYQRLRLRELFAGLRDVQFREPE